ncbi:GNAT family N-acetyltransferase [Brumimicrobium mesophilum]|uniref:GNAT family N-acetyltransferase n=1 Tax=Brumimicrobium mesophilum TaxID=392717 RepID=UPI00131B0C2F|nr:GNAT family N-acetyltransferase [Brumimicrobium mesophilum]
MNHNIKTDRLNLNMVQSSDAEKLLTLRTHPVVTKYIKRNLNITLEDIDRSIVRWRKENYLYLISTIDNNEFAGTITIWNIDRVNKQAELGYELLPEFQNKGIMSNAISAVLKYAFTDLEFELIEACTHKENLNSRKLLEKNGFYLLKDRVDEDNLNNVIYEIRKM